MTRKRLQTARLVLLPALLTAILGCLFSGSNVQRSVHAFSSGPPAGYTGAPNEEPEACAECHVPLNAGSGQISITAPQTYVPGQTYPIQVTHTNASDPTRLRWGFQLTVLDSSDEKAGNLQSTDAFTQVLNNAGPNNQRQYIEHTSAGTFAGQTGGATWTFNWTAPPIDAGPLLFYAAGNQANNDGNTSGDFVYKTFVASVPASSTPDFDVNTSPGSQAVTAGASANYTTTITPFAAFTGNVNLSASGLPAGATANFNPSSITINDATSKTSTLTITTTGATPLGTYNVTVTGTSGSLAHSSQVTLQVISPMSVDLALTKSMSPNPAQAGLNLSYRVQVTNNGPAQATNVTVTDTLPGGVNFVSSSSTQGSCSGTSTVTCSLGTIASGSTAIITIVVNPPNTGSFNNTATVTSSETDYLPSNNTANLTTLVQPAAATPTMLDENLTVGTVVSGLDQPTSMAFLGPNDFLVLEKATGRVRRVVNGVISSTVLDLAVNSASERGLLGIALHPQFATNGYVYLFWSESNTGLDTTTTDSIALLGNRVDRFIWNGSSLALDRNLIRLRAFQLDGGVSRGNHNGGPLRFGPDGKLYILFGDNGRRGLLQNIVSGGPIPDDQFGGPEPDDAHLTGVILRLNDDGSTPTDNPFYLTNTTLTGAAAANIKKIFGYGVRNGFGLAFDPLSGALWTQENGDDSFDEMNRVKPGFNGGWIQLMGPATRIAEYKAIESTYGSQSLQQTRWSPSNIADTPQTALARLHTLAGSQYTEPEFSWKYAVAPSPLGFVQGRGLGPDFEGDMLVGASRTTLYNGYLFRFNLTANRQHFAFTDPLLDDLVADNADKFDAKESESLLVGRDFGITTDIQTGPNGNVFVVSLLDGKVYEIKLKPGLLFFAALNGAQEVPANNSTSTGAAVLELSPDEKTARLSLSFSGLSSAQTVAHIHGPAAAGATASPLFDLPLGQVNDFLINLTNQQAADLKAGLLYVNVHSTTFPNGEIRGQFLSSGSSSVVAFTASKVSVSENQSNVTLTVQRSGNLHGESTVDYSTSDTAGLLACTTTNGNASERCDYQTTVGTLRFAAGESTKTFTIPIINDAIVEGDEQFLVSLKLPGITHIGSPGLITVTILDNDVTAANQNPIDDPAFFITQQYIDFLGRLPDSVGFANWMATLTGCPNGGFGEFDNPQCDRVHVSSGFFLSEEFRIRGYWAYRFYEVAFDRRPLYPEFVPDMAKVGGPQSPQSEELSKSAYKDEFVQRPEFVNRYGSMTNAQFVDTLETNAEIDLDNVGLTTQLNGGKSRAQLLREIVELKAVEDKFFIRAFVAMQYFGYLRRDPDTVGYNNWVNTLTANPADFRHMIFGFIYSDEYRHRFGP